MYYTSLRNMNIREVRCNNMLYMKFNVNLRLSIIKLLLKLIISQISRHNLIYLYCKLIIIFGLNITLLFKGGSISK